MSSGERRLGELIQDFPVAMLTTLDELGRLQSRPMLAVAREFDGTLWFFTNRVSGKVLSIAADDRVNVSYADPKSQKFISASGRGELVHDPKVLEKLWKPSYLAWFPMGLTDPDLALLKIPIECAEYWNAGSATPLQIFSFAKALLSSEPHDGIEHERLSLRH